jgi:hypothetical protein
MHYWKGIDPLWHSFLHPSSPFCHCLPAHPAASCPCGQPIIVAATRSPTRTRRRRLQAQLTGSASRLRGGRRCDRAVAREKQLPPAEEPARPATRPRTSYSDGPSSPGCGRSPPWRHPPSLSQNLQAKQPPESRRCAPSAGGAVGAHTPPQVQGPRAALGRHSGSGGPGPLPASPLLLPLPVTTAACGCSRAAASG